MKEIRLLTAYNNINPGGALFAYSTQEIIKSAFPASNVRFIAYKPFEKRVRDLLKIFKLHSRENFFYLKRYLLFTRFTEVNLQLDHEVGLTGNYTRGIKAIGDKNLDLLIVGMDIWNVTDIRKLPRFPNLYWLSDSISAPKAAYSVSGYRSSPGLIKTNEGLISQIANSYTLIGARDQFTYEMLESAGVKREILRKIPDATFLYKNRATNVKEKLLKLGINLEQPIVAMMVHGKPSLSKAVHNHYKSKGYQVIGLSMFNSYVDANLGHQLDPFEWADIFQYIDFCVSDRFHGDIFCLKNDVPFITFEAENISPSQSKILDLLNRFGLKHVYANPAASPDAFLSQCALIERRWSTHDSARVKRITEEMELENQRFVHELALLA